jgi:glycosyltransferase involved in cell wall biosynthesis
MSSAAPNDMMDSMSRDVCAIVPTYNRAGYIAECLAGIETQTLKPGRIIVVVDGSTDETLDALRPFSGRIEIIKQPNRGKSAALNNALSGVGEDYIWILDDDDVALPTALQDLYSPLAANADIGFSYGSFESFWPAQHGRPERRMPQSNNLDWLPLNVGLLLRFSIWQPGLLVRRSLYAEVGPFDEELLRSQDYDMMLRLVRHARGINAEKCIFLKREHDGTRGTATLSVPASKMLEYWKRFDRVIFERVYRSYRLDEYLPRQDGGPPEAQGEFSALLTRAVVMARKGLWNEAERDLSRACDLADTANISSLSRYDRKILSQAIGNGSYGLENVEPGGLKNAVQRTMNAGLRREIAAALVSHLPSELYSTVSRKDARDRAKILGLYWHVAGVRGTAEHIANKALARLTRRPSADGDAYEPVTPAI